jgi:DNA-binding PadR family transcriptional regulator
MADGLVEKTYDSNSKTYYRLTQEGWKEVDAPEPSTPRFEEGVEA